MEFLGWMTLIGVLLLVLALSSAPRRELPITTAIIYLVFGLVAGPLGFAWVRIELDGDPSWVLRLTEVAVIVSLFIAGLKMRVPLTDPSWRSAFLLAGPVMVLSIAGVALFAHGVLGIELGLALLLGAVLAPTDPVLASTLAVTDASSRDHLRRSLSGEAGLNDGTAFPFVVFGLAWIEHSGAGAWIGSWALSRVLWAVPAGLALGYALGAALGRVAMLLRSRQRDTDAPSDFLALALIALSYVAADAIGAWGFLSVFAAGVGMRRAELRIVRDQPLPEVRAQLEAAEPSEQRGLAHPPAEARVAARAEAHTLEEPADAAGVVVAETLSFGDTAERLLEMLLVVLIGVSLAPHWDARGVLLGLATFVVIRPASTLALMWLAPASRGQRGLIGWLGIRGIGSLYYLAYAAAHGLYGTARSELTDLVLTVVATSIVVHGVSAQPLLRHCQRSDAPVPHPA